MAYLIALLAGLALVALLFFALVVFGRVIRRGSFVGKYLMPITASLLALAMYLILHPSFNAFSFAGLSDWRCWALAGGAALLAAIIASLGGGRKTTRAERSASLLNGMLQELPQRLLTQVFLISLLQLLGAGEPLLGSTLINAALWCAALTAQNIAVKGRFGAAFLAALLSSAAFSLLGGFAFTLSGCIFLTMFAHGAEQLLADLFSGARA